MGKGIGGHTRPYEGNEEQWLTPPHIIKALGEFDLDPCAPIVRPWPTAKYYYTIEDDGFAQPWVGRCFVNSPYGPQTGQWLEKLANHANGIALVFGRTDTEFFHRMIFERAHAILFLEGRLFFHHVDGTRAKHNSGGPSVLVAYDDNSATHKSNTDYLRDSGLSGKLIVLK